MSKKYLKKKKCPYLPTQFLFDMQQETQVFFFGLKVFNWTWISCPNVL